MNIATSTLVEIDSRKLVLTNDHVLAEFDAAVADDVRTTLRIGNMVVDFETTRVARDRDADVAVLDVSDSPFRMIPDCPQLAQVFHVIVSWPPRVPVAGELTFFMGFPGSFRSPLEGGVVNVRTFGLSDVPVASPTEDRFFLQFDRDRWREVERYEDKDLAESCAGMSGSGIYARSADGPELVGLIQGHLPNFDLVRATALGGPRALRCFAELGVRVSG